MWTPDLHPRDEYGRFRLTGASGRFDRLAGRVEARAVARSMAPHIEQYRRSGQELAEFSNPFVPEAASALARHREAKGSLPRAWFRNMELHDDGTWRIPGQSGAYDSEGRRLPPAAVRGYVRVGDDPRGGARRGRSRVGVDDSPLAGGVWHQPGRYWPGRVPKLVDDYGEPISEFKPAKARSQRHREDEGAFVRAEMRAERAALHYQTPYATRDDPQSARASAEVQGGFMISPINPVSRRRSARKKRARQQNVTWVQRLNARMEGR